MGIVEPWPTTNGIRYVSTNKIPLFNKEGKISGIIGLSEDITEKKIAEENLKKYIYKLKLKNAVFDKSIAANSISDKYSNLIEVNAAAISLFGYSEEEMLSMKIVDFFKDKHVAEDILNSLNTYGNWEGIWEAIKKDGTSFIAKTSASSITDDNGEIIGYQSSITDISKQKELEHNLKVSEMMHAGIISALDEGVLVIDEKFNVLLINDWLSKVLNAPQLEAKDKNITKILPVKELDIDNVMKGALNGEINLTGEKKISLKNGTNIYVIITFKPFKVNDTIRGVLCIFKDVTIYRKMKVLNEFNAGLNNFLESQQTILDQLK